MRLSSFVGIGAILTAAGIAAWLWLSSAETEGEAPSRKGSDDSRPVPVELAQIEQGLIERRRTFTGTLEP